MKRFMLVERGCPYCEEAKKAVNFLNNYLRMDKQIRIVDNYEWELFGFNSNLFANNRIDPKDFEGYPFIYIDGIIVQPAQWKLLLLFLANLLKRDLNLDFEFDGQIIQKEVFR